MNKQRILLISCAYKVSIIILIDYCFCYPSEDAKCHYRFIAYTREKKWLLQNEIKEVLQLRDTCCRTYEEVDTTTYDKKKSKNGIHGIIWTLSLFPREDVSHCKCISTLVE